MQCTDLILHIINCVYANAQYSSYLMRWIKAARVQITFSCYELIIVINKLYSGHTEHLQHV